MTGANTYRLSYIALMRPRSYNTLSLVARLRRRLRPILRRPKVESAVYVVTPSSASTSRPLLA